MNKEQKILANRIDELRKEKGYSYYKLSYRAAVPLSTIAHIMDGTTNNPGIFTISKICDGLGISLKDFFATDDFADLLKEM